MAWSVRNIPLALAAISKTAIFRTAAFLVVVALLVAWQFGFVWPGTGTFGVIHVDSPEIYTRERLVNDRYDQDHWLRQKLRENNFSKNAGAADVKRRAHADELRVDSLDALPDCNRDGGKGRNADGRNRGKIVQAKPEQADDAVYNGGYRETHHHPGIQKYFAFL